MGQIGVHSFRQGLLSYLSNLSPPVCILASSIVTLASPDCFAHFFLRHCAHTAPSYAILLSMNSKVHHAPQAILFDMDGTLLITTQRSDQSWQHVCAQFAPRLGLPLDLLFHALRESIAAYRK